MMPDPITGQGDARTPDGLPFQAAWHGEAAQTPLRDLLAKVPEDARMWYEHSSSSHTNIPVGRLCKEALAEIDRLQGICDIIRREIAGEPPDSLAADYGGTGWEKDPTVVAVRKLLVIAQLHIKIGEIRNAQ